MEHILEYLRQERVCSEDRRHVMAIVIHVVT
jgi:hypothetical protein